MLSKLRLRVLGLVIVVPKLACLECPRLNPPGLVGLVGEYTADGVFGDASEVSICVRAPEDIASLRPAVTPLADTGCG